MDDVFLKKNESWKKINDKDDVYKIQDSNRRKTNGPNSTQKSSYNWRIAHDL